MFFRFAADERYCLRHLHIRLHNHLKKTLIKSYVHYINSTLMEWDENVEKIQGMHEQDIVSLSLFDQPPVDTDELVFDVWKMELERSLPSFWQSLRQT
ncbi:MAG: hypothetical protein QCH96_06045 [Candidatus Thermoplasmatota archaeon]|nr:hypothetical protein [Candidatus Thermoplasmatota archaeon]